MNRNCLFVAIFIGWAMTLSSCTSTKPIHQNQKKIPYGVDKYGLILRPVKVHEGLIIADTVRDKAVSRVLLSLDNGLVTKIHTLCVIQANSGYRINSTTINKYALKVNLKTPDNNDSTATYSLPTRYAGRWSIKTVGTLVLESRHDYEQRLSKLQKIVNPFLNKILSDSLDNKEKEHLRNVHKHQLHSTFNIFPGMILCKDNSVYNPDRSDLGEMLVVVNKNGDTIEAISVQFLPRGSEVTQKKKMSKNSFVFELLHPDGYVYPYSGSHDTEHYGRKINIINYIIVSPKKQHGPLSKNFNKQSQIHSLGNEWMFY